MKFYLFNLIDFVGEDKFDEMTDKVIEITKHCDQIKYLTGEVRKEYNPFDYSTLQVFSVPNEGKYSLVTKDGISKEITLNSGYVVLLKFDEITSEIMNNDKFKELIDKNQFIDFEVNNNSMNLIIDDLNPDQVNFLIFENSQVKGKFQYMAPSPKLWEMPNMHECECDCCPCCSNEDSNVKSTDKPVDMSLIGDAPIIIGIEYGSIEGFYGDDSILVDRDFEAFSVGSLNEVNSSYESYIKAKPLDGSGENTPLENIRIIVDVEDSGPVVLSYDDFVEWTKDRWNSPYNYWGDVESWDTRDEKKNRQLLLDAFKNRRFSDLETMMQSCGEDDGVGVYYGVFEYLGEFKV